MSSTLRLRQIAFGIALLAVAARVWMAWTTHATAEDFLISLRYAENLAAGRGFVYNAGERVLGTTTPLYTLLLALAAWLHLDAALVGKTCNLLADGVTCFLLARLLARPQIGQPVAGLFVALLYALSSTPINISISGMETGLVTCAGMAAIAAYLDGDSRRLWLLGAALFLLRIDGLLLFGILALALAWRQRRLPWRDMGLALLVTLPWLLFACAYFGSPIPTSLIAKLTVYSHGAETSRALVREAFATQFLGGWIQRAVTLLFVVGAVLVVRDSLPSRPRSRAAQAGNGPAGPDAAPEAAADPPPRTPDLLLPPLLWLLLYYGAMGTSRVPPFAWYFLPPWPLFLALAGIGGGRAAQWIGRALPAGARARLTRAWPLALLACGVFGLAHLRSVRRDIAQTQWQEDRLRIPMGLWFRAHARPNERILLEPIGYVGYYAQRPILDMIGLVSPEVFPSYHTPRPLADIVNRLHPAWLCLRPREAARLTQQDPSLPGSRYRYVREFHAPGRPPDFLLYRRRQDSDR